MSYISEKTLNDLEFSTVLTQIAEFANTDLGKAAVVEIKPIEKVPFLKEELFKTNEYLSSFVNENRIPNHEFEDLAKEFQLLGIENSYLDAESFLKIATNTKTVRELLRFFRKFKEYYPTLAKEIDVISFEKEIITEIEKVVTNYGEIDEKASLQLKTIRRGIAEVRGKISVSFNKVMSGCINNGYLDDIRETVIDNQRVLAVLAMYRKKVKGTFMGSSKSGGIAYIAPQQTQQLNRELQNLLFEERQEIIRILKELTNVIRPFLEILIEHQEYLVKLDVVSAKAKYATIINACMPKISKEKKIYLRDAFHPVLMLNNKEKGIETVSQTLELNEKQQIIVISGPNAGGKSITLKTIGLLQVMFQSAILIPVHERSEVSIFDTILTDIGDNQSIEYQLSTYSYRLKNMRNFLRKCNDNTLFLIDEFGTGSDPELGGALAEIFLEEFYEKNAYGIITTHYSNLKVLAGELENVSNANMQFDEKTLQPKFKLFIGQAGSSFTFEVAQKNGIPYSLINRAKKRVEKSKVRLDKTISKLQQERMKLQKTSDHLEKQKSKAIEQTDSLTDKQQKIQSKLESFQELYDNNQKMLNMGRKVNDIANKFFQTRNKKHMIAEFTKWMAMEQAKHVAKNPPVPKQEKKKVKQEKKEQEKKLKVAEKEVLQKIEVVREEKKEQAKIEAKKKSSYIFKVKDTVRLIDSRACGTIEKIEKNKVMINYGMFTTSAKLDQIELVVSYKEKK
ncbi:endonuclease MutS2 [Aureivirga sp. CE67]|uniref:endonuclease MutS2 n=1 Tax=Aureivirga sp. CE67 TaxID=1788983 RepID=UPI0018CAB476|nr:DNA mismatch repair protein MutS [Aureivirga sp. CE67]